MSDVRDAAEEAVGKSQSCSVIIPSTGVNVSCQVTAHRFDGVHSHDTGPIVISNSAVCWACLVFAPKFTVCLQQSRG